ncbi:MAG: HAD family hydrolase [Sedimentisphaerales bacterium]|nr:HAD family hydrolase [Sedimentisphaerales bacterium]
MIKSIAFDMDDTLYDEIDYYKSGFRVVAEQISSDFGLNSRQVCDNIWRVFNLGNRKTTFNTVLEEFSVAFDMEYIKKLVDVLRGHRPDIALPPTSRTVLEELKSRYKMGLITNGYLPAQELKVEVLGLKVFFDCIIYTEKLGREYWKPSPVGFEKLLEGLDTVAKQCVYVGDNLENDFISSNKIGFKTIRIIRENRLHDSKARCSEANAQYEIDSIVKLPKLLEAINDI